MATVRTAPAPQLVRYEPERDREYIRSILALLLIGLIIIEIVGLGGIGGYVLLHPDKDLALDKTIPAIKDLAGIVLTPSIALAGAVIGFYYATKEK